MSILFMLLPLLLLPLFYAVFTKAAAFLLRRTQLSWLHALVFGILALLVGGAGAILNHAMSMPLPMPLAILLGLVAFLVVGGWYLGPRAKSTEGIAVQFKGGVLLSLIAYGLVFVLGILAAVAIPLMHHAR
jgi:hypothetical protein